ncbi:hypothetical protein A0H81_09623 [Grifola frondosa]|uniref:Btz domain-containing protein n=1 Tax=Grifola frondosa TaxID=5627 RepID=A0A1C7M1L0_GRIFR|nr:hypothetical protein A0H81_09623 [Grifola frondosa]
MTARWQRETIVLNVLSPLFIASHNELKRLLINISLHTFVHIAYFNLSMSFKTCILTFIMPAPITTTALKPAKMVERSFSQPQPKKTRIARRRGRAKNGLESDEEIEREVRTDSETDDDQSSTDSESESDTTQSPPPMEIDSLINGIASKSPANGDSGIFVDSTDWADMVAEENAHGASDLPVIDFADLDRHHVEHPLPPPARARKPHKIHKRPAPARALSAPPSAPPAPSSEHEDTGRVSPIDEPVASTSQESPGSAFPSRVRGQSARQAYQQRLETDPSYVPTVGEFWGHDDRLLDKDLRSLSGWWRGRWQTRGRGRGTFGMRGRGRGFYPVPSVQAPSQEDGGEGHDDGSTGAVIEVPPIEQAWTHDGFEEMKRRDERHRSIPQQPQAPFAPLRGFGYRGRGGFVGGRGRGGFGRGGFLASPTGPRQGLPNFAMSGRPWFAMKPERMWTKQHEAFLYFDPALKPRAGQGPGFRVRLPGGKGQIVRLSPQSFAPPSLPLVAEPRLLRMTERSFSW